MAIYTSNAGHREGVRVSVSTECAPEHREMFGGRAVLTISSGDWHMQTYPTAADLRAVAAELVAAADRIESGIEP